LSVARDWAACYSTIIGAPHHDPPSVGTLRDRKAFDLVCAAQVLVEWWRQEYNTVRPHSALGYRPPAPEATA
jgi:transposase InsO family protein